MQPVARRQPFSEVLGRLSDQHWFNKEKWGYGTYLSQEGSHPNGGEAFGQLGDQPAIYTDWAIYTDSITNDGAMGRTCRRNAATRMSVRPTEDWAIYLICY